MLFGLKHCAMLLGAALLIGATGCSDDGAPPTDAGDGFQGEGVLPPKCVLTISTINGRKKSAVSTLTGDDDQDKAKPGLQIDVTVTATDLPASEVVSLDVTGISPSLSKAPQDGEVTFKGVTIGSNYPQVVLKVFDTDQKCTQDSLLLQVNPPPECEFVDPKPNATLLNEDDKDPANGSFDYDVVIQTQNATQGEVTLFVGDKRQKTVQPDAAGQVLFVDQQLEKGTQELKAEVTVGAITRTCFATINVQTDLPTCSLVGFAPAPMTVTHPDFGTIQGLGVAQDTATGTAGLQTEIEVKTETFINEITVIANDTAVASVPASGPVAKLKAITLPEGEVTVKVSCLEKASGKQFFSTPTTILVDSRKPEDISDFTCKVLDHRAGKISCAWTAVADNTGGSGMELYRLRYSVDQPINASNWDKANELVELKPAFSAGQPHEVVVEDLDLTHSYYIGAVPVDYLQNAATLVASTEQVVDFIKQERSLTGSQGLGAILATGDFNCDGYSDLAAGAPADEGDLGRVYIYRGTADGLVKTPWTVLSGTEANGRFGSGLATLKDFHSGSPNCNDLAVYAHSSVTSLSKVFVYLGKTGLSNRKDVTVGDGAEVIYSLPASPSTSGPWGVAIASAGDFNGDGITDLAVNHADGSTKKVTVYIVFGQKTIPLMASGVSPMLKALPAAAGVKITGGSTDDDFAKLISFGGRVIKNNFDDLLIAAPKTSVNGQVAGAIYLIKGAAATGTLPEEIPLSGARAVKISGGAGNSAFGSSLAFVGDMDQDGTVEFAAGDPEAANKTGQVYIFNLKAATPPASVADAVATLSNDLTGAADARFGAFLSKLSITPTSRSFDEDPGAEVIIGAPSRLSGGVGRVFEFGNGQLTNQAASKAIYTFSGPAAASSFGSVVVSARDINQDGYLDLIVGEPEYNSGQGRFFVYY